MKEYLKQALLSGIATAEIGYDKTLKDTDIGFVLYDISSVIEKYPKIFEDQEIKELFAKCMSGFKTLTQAIVEDQYFWLLVHAFKPGRDEFSDKEKHWWWWIPEKVMNEEQLKEWKKYLKKHGYK